jgi:hypothetical protein
LTRRERTDPPMTCRPSSFRRHTPPHPRRRTIAGYMCGNTALSCLGFPQLNRAQCGRRSDHRARKSLKVLVRPAGFVPARAERGAAWLKTGGRGHSNDVGMVRPAGFEPATSRFVALASCENGPDSIDPIAGCHAGLPRGPYEPNAFRTAAVSLGFTFTVV